MRRSYSSSSFLSQENLSAANQHNNAKRTLPAVAAYQSSDVPIQRAVSHSANYTPVNGNEIAEIANLDAQIAGAEATATNIVTNNGHVGVHTPTQANYMNNPTPRGWGCCVEEQLKPIAVGLGWGTQHQLPGSRPDFHKVVGANEVFVDLTSVNEAGGGGNHITYKLDRAIPHGQGRPATWKASDITHASTNPLGGGIAVPPIQNNGVVTVLHTQTFQNYHNFLHNMNANWTPQMQNLLNAYGPVSHATFTQRWNQNDRNQFVQLAQQNVQDESSEDFTIYSDDDEPMTDIPESDESNDSNGDYIPDEDSN
jgi:hypothetical protein